MKTILLSLFCVLSNTVLLNVAGAYSPMKSFADSSRFIQALEKSRSCEQNAPARAIKLAWYGLSISRKDGCRIGEARMFVQIARLSGMNHDAGEAVGYQKRALAILQSLGNRAAETAAAYLQLGRFEGNDRHFQAAEASISRATVLYRKISSVRGIFLCYRGLGNLREAKGDQEAALTIYLRAKKMAGPESGSREYLYLLLDIGNVLAKLKMNIRALQAYQEGIERSGQDKNAGLLIVFLRKAGNMHDLTGNKTTALLYHKRALAKAGEFSLPEEQARSLVSMAGILKDQNVSGSLEHLSRALGIAVKIGNKQLAAEIYGSLSEIYRQQKRFREALYALEAHHSLMDSLVLVDKVRQADISRRNYELDESRTNIQRLEFINERRTLERNLGGTAAAIAFLILVLGSYFFFNTRKLNRQLVESNLIKDKLFSIIGHDLRNPIGGITTMLSLMEKKDLDNGLLVRISAMKKQGELALDILYSLLKWGQAQLQGVEVKVVSFQPKGIISKNIALLHNQAAEKKIFVEENIDAGQAVKGDIDHFDFIIRNLLSNAIKFSYTAGKISIGSDSTIEPGRTLFSVSDQGKGISQEQQQRFKRNNLDMSDGTEGEKGTGLGLMLSREFIKANGGSIRIKSSEGEGTTFYFSFRNVQ